MQKDRCSVPVTSGFRNLNINTNLKRNRRNRHENNKIHMKDFGARMRMLRLACGLTQEEFCDMIGISDTHYRKIEAGTRTGSLELIVEMAEYFHVSLDYLLLGEIESNSKAKRDILAVIESLTRIAREL